jgi:transcription-repair coupling factor (superfamily II helicase)
VERYRAAADVSDDAPPPRLHKLGGKKWKAQRDATRAAIHEMTVELLDLYARRTLASRPPHHPDGAWQRQLESSFLFEDTPDQLKATGDVKRDMEGSKPMDRVLVGDVGYGKTEIAVRAAFKAVQSERQVAVLVPTTVLAEQHKRTFTERFADFPVRVGVLSRFAGAKETTRVLAELKAGTIDVVIGTHRLLSPDVAFQRLGLIVVDEEHRFGVKHKERLKQLRLETDVLTLTATPIPRTLHLALAGLRDMTLMQTPPRDRSPVLTFVEPWDDGLLEEGITRELDRGGQVFVVHNRIETITAIADHIAKLVPRARVGVGHGQQSERELEKVMARFVNGEIDVLVSTLIVESGLDVPNANTMFVNRADHLGLAQLYQLRGRVGRSHRRAYCYLMVPDHVDENAERRLKVLEHHTELGAGYRVALKDLEMRGAGNLLGPEQSGFVHAVGFDLYLRLLEDTVKRVMRGDDAPPPQPADVSLDVPAYLPDAYIPSAAAKLDVYRRLTALTDAGAIAEVRAEVRDRFGPLPAEADRYFALAALRQLGGPLGIEGMLVRGEEARVNFRVDALPRLKPLSAAFREVQFQVDVRRVQPLSLKLTRLGGSSILDGLLHALRTITTVER